MNKIILSCIISILLSIILYLIPNKSNYSKYFNTCYGHINN